MKMDVTMDTMQSYQPPQAEPLPHSGRWPLLSNLGRYEITGEIGSGAMGVVYKASDPFIDRLVAIKTINLNNLRDWEKKDYEARFYQEARAAGRLNHPNIITIFDLGETDGIAYIAMELMQGKELHHLLQNGQSLPVEQALDIAVQLLAGLGYAHEHGVIHRDIKPSNIMVLHGGRVKIADFGIARMDSSLSQTQCGMVMGSPLYMSPEQILNRPLDSRSDIFSVGILLYRMLTGITPFAGDTVHALMYQIVEKEPPKAGQINSAIPPALDAIIAKCMAKNPEDRYQDAQSLSDALQACRDALRVGNSSAKDQTLVEKWAASSMFGKLRFAFVSLLAVFELIEEIGEKLLSI
jgi:serine/threonine protein kinase